MSEKKLSFEKRTNTDGSPNPKYVDLLEEDKPISGQKFVCISFVSPENIIKQKNVFLFEQFLKHFDLAKSTDKFRQFISFISYKYNLSMDTIMSDFNDFVKSEQEIMSQTNITDEYKNFLDVKEEEINDLYCKQHGFQTNTRGLKVRGVYSTQEEAELRSKLLREVDPNHNVYVGPVGMWMPWDPEAYKTGRVEYLEEELNQLMSEKNKNEENAKQEFEKRVKETKQKAIEDNKKLARKTGNKLTQNIDKEGNLYGMNNTIEKNIKSTNESVTSADIRKELFEGENIVNPNKDKNRRYDSNDTKDE